MTDPDFSAIAILMDRSGSMMRIRADAEGALQAFVHDQREQPGRCTIRLSDFDTEYRCVYASTPIADAPEYSLLPRGGTALLDAIGRLVTEFGEELAAMPEDARPGKVIVVVQTDGEENSSQEWTRERVFELITHQREKYAWDFVFLGANQDAISTGTRLGFAADSSLTYSASSAGAQGVGAAMSGYVSRSRGRRAPASFTQSERDAAVD